MTRGGKRVAARGPTAEEFKAFVRQCLEAWKAQRSPREVIFSMDPIFSWDNTRIHGNVLDADGTWPSLGITPATHTLLPPYSPDMHSVIELTHARLMEGMQQYINDREPTANDTLQGYLNVLQGLFKSLITKDWVQATTHRLFIKVLPAILEAEGGYPPKHLR